MGNKNLFKATGMLSVVFLILTILTTLAEAENIYYAAQTAPEKAPREAPLCYKFIRENGLEEQLARLEKKYGDKLFSSSIYFNPDGSKTLRTKRLDASSLVIDYFYTNSPKVCMEYQQKRNVKMPKKRPASDPLSLNSLKNLTYKTDEYPNGIKLNNGAYEIQRNSGRILSITTGKINGQKVALVILYETFGGSFSEYMYVVKNYDNRPVIVDDAGLGVNTQINSVTITNNEIILDLVELGDGDGMCCPTQKAIYKYDLNSKDKLVNLSVSY